jgi:hypothetical protein
VADSEKAIAFVVDNWDSLGVEEHGGVLLLPVTIKRRNKTGGYDETPVMLRNVTNDHRFKCRATAREYAARCKLDLDRDAELVDEIENYAILSFAIRDRKPPHDQHVPGPGELLARYDVQSLAEVWGRYNAWVETLDPRFGDLDEDKLWNCITRIAAEKNPGFLAAMPGYAQATCIVFMARAALSSPTRPSWLQPPETFKAVS